MENQHRQITGYRDLSQAEIDLMNRIKAHGEATALLVKQVQEHLAGQIKATQPTYAEPKNEAEEFVGTECIDTPAQHEAKVAEAMRLKQAEPFRWCAVANTHLQEGLMALTRAVAQPSSF